MRAFLGLHIVLHGVGVGYSLVELLADGMDGMAMAHTVLLFCLLIEGIEQFQFQVKVIDMRIISEFLRYSTIKSGRKWIVDGIKAILQLQISKNQILVRPADSHRRTTRTLIKDHTRPISSPISTLINHIPRPIPSPDTDTTKPTLITA